jgi:hypothetical protein
MKKISKLQVNPEKLMKNEELLSLRGGYGGWTYCYKNDVMCANNPTGDCAELSVWFCDTYCPGWDLAKCIET